eukprot:TRINITY_DN7278_c0_g1_i10.p1 TRINITY_DN7278_c0_g1~~TRINITY_DN7278_c0_g1_i10.p1  ORF type:complete len:378 (+),score=75.13 TRINITY_DN7278_c0_g1_i10:200-1333(+)
MVKRVGKYQLGKTLGEGTFGKVKLGVNVESGAKVAIKVLDKRHLHEQNMTEQIKKEISIMKLIKHKNVVNLIDVLISRTKIYLVLELINGGELFFKLANDGRFPEPLARRYFQQLILGIEYCHMQGVCHRDLKPENLLLHDGDILKVSDFGLSAIYNQGDRLLRTTCGTPNYVAPEVLSDDGYDGFTSDIWSCGVILYVFLAGFLPFEDTNTEELFRKIKRAEFKYPPWFTQPAIQLISKILVADSGDRYTIAQIKDDPWFKVGFDETTETPAVVPVTTIRDLDDQEQTEEEVVEDLPETTGPISMNAFELINFAGAFDLSRMFRRLPPGHSGASQFTSFTSDKPAPVIISRLKEALDELSVKYVADEKSYKVIRTN